MADFFIMSRDGGDGLDIFVGGHWFRDGKQMLGNGFACSFDAGADEDWVGP